MIGKCLSLLIDFCFCGVSLVKVNFSRSGNTSWAIRIKNSCSKGRWLNNGTLRTHWNNPLGNRLVTLSKYINVYGYLVVIEKKMYARMTGERINAIHLRRRHQIEEIQRSFFDIHDISLYSYNNSTSSSMLFLLFGKEMYFSSICHYI